MMTPEEQAVLDAANRLSEARLEYARAYLLSKVSSDGIPVTDRTAEQKAIEMTDDVVTVAEAELQLALIAAVRNSK